MRRSKPVREDRVREDRILFDVVVDAYNESERALGWYYYLEREIAFPFQATCRHKRATSPLIVSDIVTVLGMADEDDCMREVHVTIKHSASNLAVPLDQLAYQGSHQATWRAIEDWHYWVGRGYEF